MNVGFLGLGKLGLPVALAVESKGHKVFGTDTSKAVIESVKKKKIIYKEDFVERYLPNTKLELTDVNGLVKNCDIIFVPIQTPHNEKYEGITRIPSERADFDYSFLRNGIKNLSDAVKENKKDVVVIIISTVLPGTIRKEIKPLLCSYIKLCYNPFFIAMGSTIRDFLEPEFVLFGVDDIHALEKGKAFYKTITNAPLYDTTIENAELIKVSYNTLISTKIAFVNTLMELCHKLENTNIDDVTSALKLANRRLISTAYMDGGMGDGGGCHPRDNIAMSYLSKKYDLSHNWFEHIMTQRESQTDWLAEIIIKNSKQKKINILGKTFKAESNLTLGSPSILLHNLLLERGLEVNIWDPFVDGDLKKYSQLYNWDKESQLFFIGTKHQEFNEFPFTKGSIVIDPWRYLNKKEGVKFIRIGDSIFNKNN
jgi:UDPglucose 6-dehydrogenase